MRCLDALVDGALVEVRLSPGDGRETGPATRLTGAGQRSGSGFNPCLYFFALHFIATTQPVLIFYPFRGFFWAKKWRAKR